MEINEALEWMDRLITFCGRDVHLRAVLTIRAALAESTNSSHNMPSAKQCAWCRGRIANKGIFANYCPLCGFDLRTASHVG
jgi:hypothetical protein